MEQQGRGYETILSQMQETYRALTGFDPDEASDIGIRLRVLAGELSSLEERLEALALQVFPQTGTGEALDRHAQMRGLARKAALHAKGRLEFSRETPAGADIPLPAGLVCATRADPQVQYETTADGVLPAGQHTVAVAARAVQPGRGGNAAPGAVCLMVSAAPGVTAVQNRDYFTGGDDAEGDEPLRARLLEGYRHIANGANSAFYRDLAMQCQGVLSAGVIPRPRGRGSVDVVVTGLTRELENDAVARLQAELDTRKEINVDVRVQNAARIFADAVAAVVVEAHADKKTVEADCAAALMAYIDSLGVGEPLLVARLTALLLDMPGVQNVRVQRPVEDVGADSYSAVRCQSVSVQAVEGPA